MPDSTGKEEIATVRSWDCDRRFGFAIAERDGEIVHFYGTDWLGICARDIDPFDEIRYTREIKAGKNIAREWTLEPEKIGFYRVKQDGVVIWKGSIEELNKIYPHRWLEEADTLIRKGGITFEQFTEDGWTSCDRDPRRRQRYI